MSRTDPIAAVPVRRCDCRCDQFVECGASGRCRARCGTTRGSCDDKVKPHESVISVRAYATEIPAAYLIRQPGNGSGVPHWILFASSPARPGAFFNAATPFELASVCQSGNPTVREPEFHVGRPSSTS